jgi:rhodanese-related sulfurtransferase
MNSTSRALRFLLLAICCVTAVDAAGHDALLMPPPQSKQVGQVERITAQQLKAKLAANQPVTILDVRSSDSYVSSDSRIKGSIHVKLRRLSSRLSLPPLKSVPRESEVVTYCACPRDETSIRAAQILLAAGFKRVLVLDGGWQMWLRANGQVEPRPRA